MPKKEHREIEVRFLEVDVLALEKKLKKLGAKDEGKELLTASIFYDKNHEWRKNDKKQFIRLRQGKKKSVLSFKNFMDRSPSGTEEIEVGVSDPEKMKSILERIGLKKARIQEKYRHTFTLKKITFDFDTWPGVPTFLEIEAKSETDLKKGARLLGLNWKDAVSGNVGEMIEEVYHIPVPQFSIYTFKKIR